MGIKRTNFKTTNKHINRNIIQLLPTKEIIQIKKQQPQKKRKIYKMIFKEICQSTQDLNQYCYDRKRNTATVSENVLRLQLQMANYQHILEGKQKQKANFPISANLLQTRDFKAIKHSLNHQQRLQKLSHSQLIVGYKLLTILKKHSKKLQGKCNLIQCYQPEKLKQLSFLDCIKSQSCNIRRLIDVFQQHLIFNYVHTLNLIYKMRPQHLKHFMPNGQLFENFKPQEDGYLSKSNLLNNIIFLGTKKVSKIKANYHKIANLFLIKCYGISNQIAQFQDSTYFFYNLLVEEGNTRLTFEQFRSVQDKLNVVLSEGQNIEQLFSKLNKFYQNRNEDWYEEICQQLSKSKVPSQIFDSLLECCQNLTKQQYLKSLNLTYKRLLSLPSDQNQQCLKFIQSMNKILNSFDDQDYNEVKLKIDIMKKAYIICLILDNFNLTYSLNTVIYSIMQIPEETQKCLNQILENYHVNRVKQFQLKLNEKAYDLQQSLELRSLLQDGFKTLNERNIEILIFRKCLDFGKYRELKQIYSQLKLTTSEYDQTISEAMLRYLKLQRNTQNIEDERKKFLEIINDVQQFKKEKFVKSKKVMNLYKFIIESKETVEQNILDQNQCNQIIFQMYRKSNNLEIPYIRLKKKLARAFDLQIYDYPFCKFMLELVQKIININLPRGSLILDDLLKNGDEIIQSEVAIIQLKLSKDGTKQNESFSRLLKGSQSADIIQTLLQFHKQQSLQIQLPEKIDILSKQMIEVPLENSISVAKFEQEYKKYYSKTLVDDIFLDLLIKNPDEAFFLLQKREPTQTFDLIKSLALSSVIHSENLLTKYLQIIVGKINIILLLQSDSELIENITQALVISQHLQIFSKQALFDKIFRKKQIIERMEQYELDNIIPELIYFRDLNLKDLKLQVFLKKLQSVNLNKYYINSEQQIKSYVKNQIKLNPAIIDLEIDLRYHFIIYEDIFGFTAKEKQIVKAFISQCILSNNDNIVNYDRIYKQIIKKDFKFEVVQQDFFLILEIENVIIICELAKYYYNKEKNVLEIYTTKLISSKEKIKEKNFWQSNTSTDSFVVMAKQQIKALDSQKNSQNQEIY